MLVLLVAAAFAGPTVALGVGGIGGPGWAGLHGVGRVRVEEWPSAAFSVEFGAREGLATDGGPLDDSRSIGAIFLGGRTPVGVGNYLRAGAAHHHEAPLSLALAHPFATLFAIHPDLVHRTGVEIGLGRAWDVDALASLASSVALELSATWLPDAQSPSVYAFGEIAFTPRFRR